VCVALTGSPAVAQSGAVRCGKLVDVRTGKVLTDQIVSFENGKIARVATTSAAPARSTVDLSRATCLPKLIDVQTHLTNDPTDAGYKALGVPVPRSTVTGVKNARLTLQAGFTTVRNVDARGFSDVALRDGINAGEVVGPRMLVSGPALGITGGHCD